MGRNGTSRNMAILTEIHNQDKTIPKTSIGEFFAHKNVFITGGTGFLGTVLVEALLSSSPDIGVIYLLVREKYGYDPNERISRMLSKPIFAKHNEKTLQKVVPIVGELSAPNLGFKDELMNELLEKVHVIYHSAATIRFRTPLRAAIKTNLTGTLRTIEFAKRVKHLAAYIYLSTAFCNSNQRGYIEEKIYKSHYDPYDMIKMAEDDSVWNDFTMKKTQEFIIDHPNTYTFTKNLAENLLEKEMSGLPTAIVRPSIVYGTWEHPTKGWVGNATSGHLGFMAGYSKGVFRTMTGNPNSTVDAIPCDYVINSALIMGWYVGTRKLEKPEIIHCTSGEVNPFTLGDLERILNEVSKKHPVDKQVFIPKVKIRNGWRYALFFYLFQIMPAFIVLLPEKLLGVGMTHHSLLGYMTVFHRAAKAFEYFLDKNFRYSFKNSLKIIDQLNDDDKKRYNFDCSNCDWTEFMSRCIIGIRHYYFRESLETTRKHHYIRYFVVFATYTFGLIFYSIICLIMSQYIGFTYSVAITICLAMFLIWL